MRENRTLEILTLIYNSRVMAVYLPAYTIHGDAAVNVLSEDVRQLYDDTCAIKSQQLILKDFGIDLSEDQLRDEAIANGWYDGGTSASDIGKLLELHGVGISQYDNANIFNLVNELAQGHKVVVGLDSGELWEDNLFDKIFEDSKADHALIVSGIDTSDPENVKVILTDPGTGDLLKEYPMDRFVEAWQDSNCFMMTTNDPVPDIFISFDNPCGFDMSVCNVPMIGRMPYDIFYNELAFLNCCNDIPASVYSDFIAYVNGDISNFSLETAGYLEESVLWDKLNVIG